MALNNNNNNNIKDTVSATMTTQGTGLRFGLNSEVMVTVIKLG